MANPQILLIDDDAVLLELLTDHLTRAGYRVLAAANGHAGLSLATDSHPDLAVVDVMMPGMDGWEVCQRLRDRSAVPVIMLTAKGEELDKLHGFRLGVDDYVTKPFSFAELTARVGAVLSRAMRSPAPAQQFNSGDLTIDFGERRVTLAGQLVELTPTEYRLLETLARHARHTISTEQLLVDTWGPSYPGDAEQVKHFVWALRKKIEADPGAPKHLLTERGFGYRFE
jgi:two-component system KDP operon response regulator KdpE